MGKGKGKNRRPQQNLEYDPNYVPKPVYQKYYINNFGFYLLFIEYMGASYNWYPFYFSFNNTINIFLNPAIIRDIPDDHHNPFQIKKSIHSQDTLCVIKITDNIKEDIHIDMNGIGFWNIDINSDKYNKCKNSFVFSNINTIFSINSLNNIRKYINKLRPFYKFIYNNTEFNFSNSRIEYTPDKNIIENLTFLDADNNSINIRFVIKYNILQYFKDFARYDKIKNIIDDYSCEYIPAGVSQLDSKLSSNDPPKDGSLSSDNSLLDGKLSSYDPPKDGNLSSDNSLLVGKLSSYDPPKDDKLSSDDPPKADNIHPNTLNRSNKRWVVAIILAFILAFTAIIAIVIKK